jgi:hypothetical protein
MDPRHRGLFGAAWTLAMIGELARGGVDAVSPAAPVGEFGIVHRKLSYAQPWFDGLGHAAVYPVYHVVAGMAHGAGKPGVEAISSDGTRLLTASWREADGGTSLWLANLQDGPQRVALRGLADGALRVTILDESTFETAAADPDFMVGSGSTQDARELELGAYGVARVQAGA